MKLAFVKDIVDISYLSSLLQYFQGLQGDYASYDILIL